MIYSINNLFLQIQKIQMDGTPVQMNLPWGLTPEDLHAIHRTAEDAAANQRREQQMDNDMQEVTLTLRIRSILKN